MKRLFPPPCVDARRRGAFSVLVKRHLSLFAAACVLAVGPPAPSVEAAPGRAGCVTTAERIKGEALQALVTGPAETLLARDIARAEREFEALLAGRSGLEAADTLTAFASELNTAYSNGDPLQAEANAKAVVYARRALDEFIALYGEEHAEVALAWQTLGELSSRADPSDPDNLALGAFDTAYRMSAKVVGATEYETALYLHQLAKAWGRPNRVGGDAARIIQVAGWFEQALTVTASLTCKPDMPQFQLLEYMDTMTLNGRPRDAIGAFQRWQARIPGWEFAAAQAGMTMRDAGYGEEARELMRIADMEWFGRDAASPDEDAQDASSVSPPRP